MKGSAPGAALRAGRSARHWRCRLPGLPECSGGVQTSAPQGLSSKTKASGRWSGGFCVWRGKLLKRSVFWRQTGFRFAGKSSHRFDFLAFFFFLAVFLTAFLADFFADFFADDFLPAFLAVLDFLAAFLFGVTFLATLLAAFLTFFTAVLAASLVASAALLIASVKCSRTGFSSSISSPSVVNAATIAGFADV